MKLFVFITSLLLCLQVNAQLLNPNTPIPVLVKYEIGGIKLTKDSSNKLMLDSLVTFLKQHPELKVEVDNHTDRAYLQHNTNISQRRAQCIADTLIQLGIDPQRIVAKGWGNRKLIIPQQQIDAMKTQAEKDDAMAKNRRTEIRILSMNFGHETFNWNDSVFYLGSKRQIHVEYNLDDCGIADRSKPTLDSAARFLKKNSTLKIEVADHTDPRGSEKHNLILSQARSQSITNYFISKGVDSARISPKGYGFGAPLPGCSKEEIDSMKTQSEKDLAYQKDRRTEIIIIGK